MDLKFQTMTVPSRDPETAYLKFGLKTVDVTPSLCPLKLLSKAGSETLPLMIPPLLLLVIFGLAAICWLECALA